MVDQSKMAFSGFIGNTHDALIIFEACRRGILPRAQSRLSDGERRAIKSGDIFVFNEDESKIKRWTDGKRWSPSRILNNFLIYREVKADDQGSQSGPDAENAATDEGSASVPEPASPLEESAKHADTSMSATDEPVASTSQQPAPAKPSEIKHRNITGGLELIPNRKEDGLIKKTISVAGLHMISYYTAADVLSGRLRQPTTVPELSNLDISHPFLMAQFFRHPPQVSFDEEGIPHFSGITDDEPMLRKPPSQQGRSKRAQMEIQQQKQQQQQQHQQQQQLAGRRGSLGVESAHPPFERHLSLPGSVERPYLTAYPPGTASRSFESLSLPSSVPHVQAQPDYHQPYPPEQSAAGPRASHHSSSLAHLTVHTNPLLPSSSRHAVQSSFSNSPTPDVGREPYYSTGYPRSSTSHPVRHEPYRIPQPKQRHSITDLSNYPSHSNAFPLAAQRQASLPSAGFHQPDWRPSLPPRNSAETTDSYNSSISQSSYPYTQSLVAGDHSMSSSPAPHYLHPGGVSTTMQQHSTSSLPLDNVSGSPRSFHSTAPSSHSYWSFGHDSLASPPSNAGQSYIQQSGQQAAVPMYADQAPSLQMHFDEPSASSTLLAGAGAPNWPYPLESRRPSFVNFSPQATSGHQTWYQPSQTDGQYPREYGAQAVQAPQEQPSMSFLPQEQQQHLSGVLPQTGYSPLLPASAAYGRNFLQMQDFKPITAKEEVVEQTLHHHGHISTASIEKDSYVSGPPPPQYSYPQQPSAHKGSQYAIIDDKFGGENPPRTAGSGTMEQ